MTSGTWSSVLAGIALVVGALLPWAVVRAPQVGQAAKTGFEGGGLVTAGLGVAIAVVAVKGATPRAGTWISVLSALAIVMLVADLQGVRSLAMGAGQVMGLGWGFAVTAAGGATGVWGGLRRREELDTSR